LSSRLCTLLRALLYHLAGSLCLIDTPPSSFHRGWAILHSSASFNSTSLPLKTTSVGVLPYSNMHEIAPLSELNRRTANKSTPPTRSPSPYGGPLLDTPQAGGLSPPPPSHYLRDKARTGGTQESIARLKKRSEIYERSRRSRTPGSPSLSREELLAQQERQLSWASGSPLLNRSRAGSENLGDDSQTLDLTPLSFLSTDPMSGSTGGSRSLQDDVSSPLVTMYSEAGLTVETGSADSHFPSSFRGTRRATHSHRLTKSGSSLSTLSSASSNLFPLSVDPQ
jgi:hypothetical protein